MRLVGFRTGGRQGAVRLGVQGADGIRDASAVLGPGAGVAALAALPATELAAIAGKLAAAPLVEAAILAAPIPRPARNIFCVGKNYNEHAKEFASSGFDATAKEVVPEAPVVFTKQPTAVIGTGDDILASLDDTGSVDYEGELAVVIGAGGRGIARAEAMRHVFGYTIVNDVTSRTLQHRHRQWAIGKGLDSFCPMGPALVTADELGPVGDLHLRTWVNGELRQDAHVRDLIFDIPTLIETISRYITLEPGDIIATGTPAGVGIGFSPPRFLKPGDVVRVEISGIGAIENTVR